MNHSPVIQIIHSFFFVHTDLCSALLGWHSFPANAQNIYSKHSINIYKWRGSANIYRNRGLHVILALRLASKILRLSSLSS